MSHFHAELEDCSQAEVRDWVESAFALKKEELDGATFLYAHADSCAYEEWCTFIFEQDGELFENYASHCSCDGYEDQWAPGLVTKAALSKWNKGLPGWAEFVASLP